jgi:hypothetical protein
MFVTNAGSRGSLDSALGRISLKLGTDFRHGTKLVMKRINRGPEAEAICKGLEEMEDSGKMAPGLRKAEEKLAEQLRFSEMLKDLAARRPRQSKL